MRVEIFAQRTVRLERGGKNSHERGLYVLPALILVRLRRDAHAKIVHRAFTESLSLSQSPNRARMHITLPSGPKKN